VTTLLLAGISIGSLCGAAISLALSLSPNPYAATEIVFWLLGSFSDRTMDHVSLVLPFLLASATLLFMCGPAYRALALGEDTARSLGVSVDGSSIVTACAIAIGVGAATAVSGAIGFVGLMAPHFVRRRCGGDPMATLAPSLLMGSALMLASDIVVRLIPSTGELRVGAVTALLGAPFFLYVVLAKRPGLGRVR
jgi:iron complex transport system permease protein